MSDELKPCPFCGGEAKYWEYEDERDVFDPISLGWVDTRYFIEHCVGCDSCEIVLVRSSKDEAVAAWNDRAAADEQFAMAAHDGRAWQVVRECHIRYHGGAVSEGGMEAEDWYYCDACGEELPEWAQELWSEYEFHDHEGAMPFRHCPNCGSKVVR